MNEKLVTLYRPCGQKEYDLVAASGFKRWPARLPEQPIFYPVTNEQYAFEVNKWNVTEFGKGYVTRFYVKESFMSKYRVETVGGSCVVMGLQSAEGVVFLSYTLSEKNLPMLFPSDLAYEVVLFVDSHLSDSSGRLCRLYKAAFS